MALRIMGKRPPELEHLTEEDIIAALGTPEEQVARLRQFREDMCVLRSDAVRTRYPGEHVAVFHGEVVAHSSSYEAFLEQIHSQSEARQSAAVGRVPLD